MNVFSDNSNKPTIYIEEEVKELIGAIFASLKKINQTKTSKLVIDHLPTENEHRNTINDSLYDFFRHEAKKRKILYVDVLSELRRISSSEVKTFFFQKDIEGFDQSNRQWSDGKGHLTSRGNFFVAKKISKALVGIDALTTH